MFEQGVTVTNTRAIVAQLQRYQAEALGDIKEELRSQFRAALRFTLSITPPGMGNTPYTETKEDGSTQEWKGATAAKKRGEARVESDIRKIFMGVEDPAQVTVRSIPALHQSRRDKRGRIRAKEWTNKAKAIKTDLERYIKTKKDLVGYLASGWVPGMEAVGLRIPAWVRRHSAPGTGSFTATRDNVTAEASNQVPWFIGSEPHIQRRIDFALKIQAGKFSREIDYLLKKRARANDL